MSPEALTGMELGKSVIQRLLGQGTMGTIYLAVRADRQVAIKVFFPASSLAEADNALFLQRLEEKVARGASLEHPHILPVLEHGRQEQLIYQITPYIAGESLEASFARARALPFVHIQHYLEQLAAALDYAHARGILHGDVKASNILVTPAGDLFITDFGLASLTIEKNFASVRRPVAGMLNAIAPEYVLSQAVDGRADIYSLGAVLYQMVTGVPPFQGNSIGEVAMKHVQSAPPSPRALRPDLPQAAEQALLRALAKRPAERYAHASELASAFRLALAATSPAQVESKATHTLNILSELSGDVSTAPAAGAAAPRRGGLFDPKWRTQTSVPAASANAQNQSGEGTQLSPASALPEEQPTNPVPLITSELIAETEQASATAQNQQMVLGKVPTLGFPAPPEATGNLKRTGLPGFSGLQADAQEQSQAFSAEASGTLQVEDAVVNNTDELKNFSSQQLSSPTGMLSALAQFPANGDGTGTMKLTESVKIVQVPIAGQPGRFMTGYLPAQPSEQPAEKPARGLSTRMRIISIVLAVIVVAAGSGVFLALRSHNNQTNQAAKARHTPNLQATAGVQASATANANIIFSDTLSQNTNQWPTGSQGWFNCEFQDSAYHITNHDKQKSASVLANNTTVNGPFTYSLTMEQVKGNQTAPNNLFGMILYTTIQNVPNKPQVDKFYAFEILNNSGGQYEFWKYDNSKKGADPWNKLWNKNFGKEFKQGNGPSHVNTVKITASGGMFTFIVNDKQVGTWKDHSFSSGGVGMLVNLDGSEVAFSNLLLTYS
ncbi:MAG TPA: serine/threonine-protein kinase [Ktedonobacteraceae bacterium]